MASVVRNRTPVARVGPPTHSAPPKGRPAGAADGKEGGYEETACREAEESATKRTLIWRFEAQLPANGRMGRWRERRSDLAVRVPSPNAVASAGNDLIPIRHRAAAFG